MPMDQLTDRDRAILDLERSWWRYPGTKETTIRARFGISSARYHQILNHLIDTPAALAHDPTTVHRLQRLREARARQRRARRHGFEV